nr:hypothetical protein [Tanacetum cinerariifolium]
VDAPAVAIEEQLERIEYVVDEKIKRPRKRKKENEDESSSANVLSFGNYFKQDEKVESSLEGRMFMPLKNNLLFWYTCM